MEYIKLNDMIELIDMEINSLTTKIHSRGLNGQDTFSLEMDLDKLLKLKNKVFNLSSKKVLE